MESGQQLAQWFSRERIGCPNNEGLSVGDVVESSKQLDDESARVPRIQIVEESGGRERRIVETVGDRVALLGRRARPLLRGDHVARAERGEAHGIFGLEREHAGDALHEEL